MKTTRKQLVDFTIRLVKEVSKQNEDITIDYQNSSIHIWFHTSGASRNISLYLFNDLKTNKDKFKQAILEIRGIIL